MPDIAKWIKAQLKKGYTKQQIKKTFIKHKYTPETVAEVDKFESSTTTSKNVKKISSKLYLFIGLFIGVVLVLWLLGTVPFLSKQPFEIVFNAEGEEIETGEEVISRSMQKELDYIEKLCKSYPIVENEVSCRNAIAIGKYPDKVYSVNKEEVVVLVNGQNSTENVWVLGINLDDPIEIELPDGNKEISDKFEIFVNVNTWEVSINPTID